MAEYGTHQTKVWLCNVPWDNSYKHTRLWTNASEQKNYFLTENSNTIELTGTYRFIDGDGSNSLKRDIKIAMRPEESQKYNYLIYTNNSTSDKPVYNYMFINSVDYINYETSLLHLEEDLLQNYMFVYNLQQCMIKRENVSDDNNFLNLIEDDYKPANTDYVRETANVLNNVSYKPYICCKSFLWFSGEQERPDNPDVYAVQKTGVTSIGSYSTPFSFIVCDSFYELNAILEAHQEVDSARGFVYKDAIVSVGVVSTAVFPKKCIVDDSFSIVHPSTDYWVLGSGSKFESKPWSGITHQTSVTIDKPTTLKYINPTNGWEQNYTPKNNKLLTYPYLNCSIAVPGQSIDFSFDDITGQNERDQITFNLKYNFTDTFQCFASIVNYKGSGSMPCYDTLFEIPVAATIPTDVSTYFEYMQENRQSNDNKILTATLTAMASAALLVATKGASLAMGAVDATAKNIAAAEVASGAAAVGAGMSSANTMLSVGSDALQKKMGDHNVTNGTIGPNSFLIGNNLPPRVFIKQLDYKYVQKTDEYFSKYGYAVNRLGRPSLNSRTNWNYIKTEGCKIRPQTDSPTRKFMNNDAKVLIEAIYDNGVTLWHNNNVGAYGNYDNPIRS